MNDQRIPLISFTGSTEVGRRVSETVARRLGRTILELGGNNGIIVMDDANLDLALRAVLFGAVGTAGQRCTTTRRLFLQRGIAARFTEALVGGLPAGEDRRPAGRRDAHGSAGQPRAPSTDMMEGIATNSRTGRRNPLRRRDAWAAVSCSRRWCARRRTCRS